MLVPGKSRFRRVRLLLGANLVFAAGFLPACDEVPAARSAGVTLAGTRAVPEFLYVLCAGEQLKRVQLVDRVGGSPFDGDDDVLWEVASPSGSDVGEIPLGNVPEGFVETLRPPEDLTSFDDLVAVFDTSLFPPLAVGFDPDALEPGRVVMFDGEVKTASEFREEAVATCP